MCTNVTITTPVEGSAKGPQGWMSIDTARVSFDHPYHASFDHTLNIDLVNERDGAPTRIAVELSPEAARAVVRAIEEALVKGEAEAGMVDRSAVIP